MAYNGTHQGMNETNIYCIHTVQPHTWHILYQTYRMGYTKLNSCTWAVCPVAVVAWTPILQQAGRGWVCRGDTI